jgi:hypothetical protein
MSRLDHTRDSAFATGNEAALTAVYAPGSAVLHRELASLRGLVTHNSHARGLHLEISSVSLLARTSMTVTLRVIDRLPAYELVSHGRVVAHHAGRSPRAWRVVLVHSDAAWRIVSIG